MDRDDLDAQLAASERLLREEHATPSDRDGERQAELEEMRDILLARIREKIPART
jgi:hypothetical protein